jgi:hypothetical protein
LTAGLLLGLYSRGRGGVSFFLFVIISFFHCKARRRKVSLKERESAQKKGFLIKGECTEMQNRCYLIQGECTKKKRKVIHDVL